MRYLLTILIGARLSAECVSVSGDQITAADIAQALPEFEQADPLHVIGYAPVQGTQRTFSSRELGLWALRLHVQYQPQPMQKVCFERSSRILTLQEVQSAIRTSIDAPGAQIEVLDFSRSSAPPGNVEFPMNGASHSSSDDSGVPILWRGRIVTTSGRSFPIWAKVHVSIETEQITANVALARGTIICEEQVSVARVSTSLFAASRPPSLAAVVGRLVRRDIPKGQPIQATALEEPRLILPGDAVHVQAQSGQAQISFDAKARTGGRRGDSVLIQNPINGRTFQALIIDKGKVEAKSSPK